MRLSCLARSFFAAISRGEMPLSEWLRLAAELGLDGVECSPMFVPPLGNVSPREFRRLADEFDLAVSNFTCYSDFTQPDPEARQREVAAMLANVEVAGELGSSNVRILAGQQWPGVSRADGIGWVVDAARQITAAADRVGLQVVIENHTRAFTWRY